MKTSTHDLDAETEAFAKKVKELFLLQDLDHSSRQSRWHSVMAMINLLHIHHDESSPGENSGLPVLDLSGNELEDAEAEKLADALKENANALVPMRWYIKLQDNQIGDAGAAALAAALKQKVSVQNLYLQYNRIGDAGTAATGDGGANHHSKTTTTAATSSCEGPPESGQESGQECDDTVGNVHADEDEFATRA